MCLLHLTTRHWYYQPFSLLIIQFADDVWYAIILIIYIRTFDIFSSLPCLPEEEYSYWLRDISSGSTNHQNVGPFKSEFWCREICSGYSRLLHNLFSWSQFAIKSTEHIHAIINLSIHPSYSTQPGTADFWLIMFNVLLLSLGQWPSLESCFFFHL